MPFRAPSARAGRPGGPGGSGDGALGRFPGFDVLDQVEHWDDVTAGVVLARLDPAKDYSFFTPAEQATASALFDLLLAQGSGRRVPVVQLVDRRLALGETDGWRYDDMPEDGEAWRVTLAGLDDDARLGHGRAFHDLDTDIQARLIQSIQDNAGEWRGMKAAHVWSLWTRYACAAFYSHPWAWNEIGFGGPAYPRGYKALGENQLEPWEVRDSRPKSKL